MGIIHTRVLFLIVVFSFSINSQLLASQQTQVTIGNIVSRGTGCAPNSTGISYQSDSRGFSVLFSDSTVEASQESSKTYDQKRCDLIIPFNIPRGLSIAMLNIDYRGFASVPKGALSRFRESSTWNKKMVTFPFRHSILNRISKDFRGPYEDEFILKQREGLALWSPCNQVHSTLKISLMWEVFSNKNNEQTVLSLDSSDGVLNQSTGIDYSLKSRACNQNWPGFLSVFSRLPGH